MRPIQFILILGLLASLLLYRSVFRSTLRDRILVLGFLLAGLLAVLFPDYTSRIAEFLGVGRGSDLVMYFFFVAAIFFAILFYSKLSRIEQGQTELIRFLAISTARFEGAGPEADPPASPVNLGRETPPPGTADP
jgi:small membrane protein